MGLTLEKKVGIFFVATIIVVAVLMEMIGSLTLFRTQIDYRCYFEEVVGINKGDMVRLSGVPVGKVSDISLENDRVRVDFYIEQEGLVRESTIAIVKKTNLLGGTFLGLETKDKSARLLEQGAIVATEKSSDINSVIDTIDKGAQEFLDEATIAVKDLKVMLSTSAASIAQITEKANRGNGLFATVLNDKQLAQDARELVSSLKTISSYLERGEGTLGQLIRNKEIYDNLRTTTESLQASVDKIQSGEGTLGKIINNDEFYGAATQLVDDLGRVANALSEGDGTLARLIHDPEMHTEFSGLVERAHSIATKIDEGKGSLGRVVNEDGLYLDVQVAAKKLEKTAEGLRDSGPISALGSILGAFF